MSATIHLQSRSFCNCSTPYSSAIVSESITATSNLKTSSYAIKVNTVKLADFGLATTKDFTTDFGCGSTVYMSPECHKRYGASCYQSAPNDIWSLGIHPRQPHMRTQPLEASRAMWRYLLRLPSRPSLSPIHPPPLQTTWRHPLSNLWTQPQKTDYLGQLTKAIIHCPHFTVYPTPASSPIFSDRELQISSRSRWSVIQSLLCLARHPLMPLFRGTIYSNSDLDTAEASASKSQRSSQYPSERQNRLKSDRYCRQGFRETTHCWPNLSDIWIISIRRPIECAWVDFTRCIN